MPVLRKQSTNVILLSENVRYVLGQDIVNVTYHMSRQANFHITQKEHLLAQMKHSELGHLFSGGHFMVSLVARQGYPMKDKLKLIFHFDLELLFHHPYSQEIWKVCVILLSSIVLRDHKELIQLRL